MLEQLLVLEELLPQVQLERPQEQAVPELPEPEQPEHPQEQALPQELPQAQLEQEQHMGCSSLS